MLTITLLGTAATMPLPDRALTAALAECGGHALLFDCGEGTQAAARRAGVNLMKLDAICLTHYHGDHIFGLPGLLQTLGCQGRERPLTLYGPEGLGEIWPALRTLADRLQYLRNLDKRRGEVKAAIEEGRGIYNNIKKHTMANIKPLGQRVLVKRIEAETKTAGGLFLPDTAKEKPQEAEVISVGTGGRDEKGALIEFTVKPGDRVLISKYGGTEIKLDGEDYLILSENDILAIIG